LGYFFFRFMEDQGFFTIVFFFFFFQMLDSNRLAENYEKVLFYNNL